MAKNETYLVASASGQLGRQVLEALLKRGAEKIIATTRTPESLADYARRGVEVRHADYNQPEGLAHAFRDATRLLICLLYTSPSPRDRQKSRMPSSA